MPNQPNIPRIGRCLLGLCGFYRARLRAQSLETPRPPCGLLYLRAAPPQAYWFGQWRQRDRAYLHLCAIRQCRYGNSRWIIFCTSVCLACRLPCPAVGKSHAVVDNDAVKGAKIWDRRLLDVVRSTHQRVVIKLLIPDLHHVKDDLSVLWIVLVPAVIQSLPATRQSH